MSKLRIAVVGFGNVGESAATAVQMAEDMEMAAVVRRRARRPTGLDRDIAVIDDLEKLSDADVALLTVPTRQVRSYARICLRQGLCTVDSFDIHREPMWEHICELAEVAKAAGTSAVTAAGWDPGTNSFLRCIMKTVAARGVTHTNYGPGMSLGHSVVCRNIEGVHNALSMTIPAGRGEHCREVYVELEDGASLQQVSARIKRDPYFASDETVVKEVEDISQLADLGHGAEIERRGASADAHNTNLRFEMRGTNPAMTAQVMVCAARAAVRMAPGAYTLPEVPPMWLLPGDRETKTKDLV